MPDGSGQGGGDVQSRIVGYYEAWKVNDVCAAVNLGMKNIPLGSLTHLIVSFGYITPGDFKIEPMPGVSGDTLSAFTAIKSSNPSTKIMISLGGWSFTDNGTDTQAVFTDLVSSHSNREAFISNLLGFLSHYAFDGVDFDWEYPGAPDRGGHDGDAEGYSQLLSELQVAMILAEVKYVVSFTVPTSYYYLSNYGTPVDSVFGNILKQMTTNADMVNVMSYDLHGTWDGPKDQIGSIVLAHTNLTEIQVAFDLFWRNDIEPSKLNLGVGFYGRSYQLSDPSCSQPGCPFAGGADAGPCTQTSGILSYKEIMNIIAQNDITPTWDQTDAVKYIVWDNDQWVSFDDEETFQQKIKWANANGIGGLSIWAIDQDTDDLQALQGLLYPKSLNAFYDNTTDASHWQQVQGGQCDADNTPCTGRLTDCNKKCTTDSPYQADKCHWQGKPGSCYDNVCKFDTEVQLTQSYDGGGDSCGIQLSRDRVFCCTAPGGVQPFLPVPLEYLFKSPPTGDNVDAEFKLNVDDTWGGTKLEGDEDTPNDAAFGFFVMTSPEEIQISLKKRDGSHWEVFDCMDAVSEEAQTVRMFCNDDSPNSNCHRIHLGHGVPGTILEMPKGCGPGSYSVAVDMVVSKDQTIPGHIRKRTTGADPVVYDLTFDYDFRRVPRDLGETQWRLDYSNEEGYWDSVVDSPGQTRRKRSFHDSALKGTPGSHKRWLEDSWHGDMMDHRAGLISREELHARWFGSDAVEWLKGLFTVAVEAPAITHQISETLNMILLDESYQCTISGVDVAAKLLVQATTSVQIDTSFGLTIVATLGVPPDLSQSYMYFKNSGEVTALFTIEALVSAQYDTQDIELFGLQNFGATFSIPGILTVGPNFKIYGSVNFDLALSGKFQAHVTIAKWDTQLGFPELDSDDDPQDITDPNADGTQEIGKPTIDWSIDANGQITAHVKPTISFGIEFNQKFINIDPATVNIVADGWVQAYASATYGSSDQNFCYGSNAACELYAQINVPKSMGWLLPGGQSKYPIWTSPTYAIIPETCSSSEPNTRRGLYDLNDTINSNTLPPALAERYSSATGKRDVTIGPLVHIPQLACPGSVADEGGSSNISGCPVCGENSDADSQEPGSKRWLTQRDDTPDVCELELFDGTDDQISCNYASGASKRNIAGLWDGVSNETLGGVVLEKRLTQKDVGALGYTLNFGQYNECGEAKTSTIDKNYVFQSSTAACLADIVKLTNGAMNQLMPGLLLETDHVYEAQTLANFLTWLADNAALGTYQKPTAAWVVEVILGQGANGFWLVSPGNNGLRTPANGDIVQIVMAYGFGRSDGAISNNVRLTKNRGQQNLALVLRAINGAKSVWFGPGTPDTVHDDDKSANKGRQRIRNAASPFKYLNYAPNDGSEAVWNKWMRVSNWIDLVCFTFDQQYPWGMGQHAGEPTNSAGTPSLRALYAYFIDAHLAAIEAKARAWSPNANADFNNFYPPTNANERAWVNSAFGPNGFASANALRFPRPGGTGPSPYGAYANQQFTLNGGGQQVNLGSPGTV
ncbi:putative glycosyl hydrolases family 18 protein [Diplogelasinospora grovesii]|uniref:chitinase n=1 Tax=Diplogelasinospora grovesii TaxID=303347 RepID=A0AAN6MWX6_9PEZI|nr:putative glycosyl hydrolases family 18 protein [Diplogelasinospora grovesii]